MIEDYKLSIPQLPGFDMDDWLKNQANLLQNMSKNARRNAKNLSSKSAGSMGDAVATMPYNAEDIRCPINCCVKPVGFLGALCFKCIPFSKIASCIPSGRPSRASRFAARRWRWWCSGSLAWIDLLDRSNVSCLYIYMWVFFYWSESSQNLMIEDPNLDCFKIYKKMQPCAHVYMCIYIYVGWYPMHTFTRMPHYHTSQGMNACLEPRMWRQNVRSTSK